MTPASRPASSRFPYTAKIIFSWVHMTDFVIVWYSNLFSKRICQQNTHFNTYTKISKRQQNSPRKNSHVKCFKTTNFDRLHCEALPWRLAKSCVRNKHTFLIRAGARTLIGGGCIFIYLGYARLISFEINFITKLKKLVGQNLNIYEYTPPISVLAPALFLTCILKRQNRCCCVIFVVPVPDLLKSQFHFHFLLFFCWWIPAPYVHGVPFSKPKWANHSSQLPPGHSIF